MADVRRCWRITRISPAGTGLAACLVSLTLCFTRVLYSALDFSQLLQQFVTSEMQEKKS